MVLKQIKKRFKLPYVSLRVNCDREVNRCFKRLKINTGSPLDRVWRPNMIILVDYLNNY